MAAASAPPDDDAAEGSTKGVKRTATDLEATQPNLDARDKEVAEEQKEHEHTDGRDAAEGGRGEGGRNGGTGKRARREDGKLKKGQNKARFVGRSSSRPSSVHVDWERFDTDLVVRIASSFVHRKFKHVKDEVEMCNAYASTKTCNFGDR